jgi:hypothetical protein
MADVGPALVAGGASIVGVVAGAGLTYWLGALNRRHQEEREDKTRWYEARLRAYVELNQAIANMTALLKQGQPPDKERQRIADEFDLACAAVRLVGSSKAAEEALVLYFASLRFLNDAEHGRPIDWPDWHGRAYEMQNLARQDLGYPDLDAEMAAAPWPVEKG